MKTLGLTLLLGILAGCSSTDADGPSSTAGGAAGNAGSTHAGTGGGGSSNVAGAGGNNAAGTASGGTNTAGADPGGGTGPTAFLTGQLAAGYKHTCVIKADKHLVCWGSDADRQSLTDHFEGLVTNTFEQVAAGDNKTCAVGTDQFVDCGIGTPPVNANEPVLAVALAGTGPSSCALLPDKTLSCSSGVTNAPTDQFSQIEGGPNSYCGVKADKQVACWGGSPEAPPAGDFSIADAGDDASCGLHTDGSAVCWGSVALALDPNEKYVQVSVGAEFVCGLKQNGTVTCKSPFMMLAGEDMPDAARDVMIPQLAGVFVEISAGPFHVCGLRENGKVACSGSNLAAQSTPPAELQ